MKRSFVNVFTSRSIFFFLFLLLFTSNSYSQSLTAEQIYKKVTNAVVVVHAYDANNQLASQGSGVVLNDKGYVVTNYHVLAGNDRLEILHGKEIVPYVDIIGIDVEKDILILKIEAKRFPAIKVGDSKSLSIGQKVYAIGSPMGLENSISEGIISGLRSLNQSKRNFIQITASISSGSSGGAVVNDKGQLIGISALTAKGGQNLNFAIPIMDILSIKISSYIKNEAYKYFELFNRAFNANKRGNYNEAIKYYTLYTQRYPNDEGAYNNRGIAKKNLEDYRGAIQDYNKAIEINPNNADAYNNLGIAKNSLEDYRGAIQDYNKAIEINPNDADTYFNRGSTRCESGDPRGGIKDYSKAIEINPNDADAYCNRGIAKNSIEDYKGAIADFSKAIGLNAQDALAYYERGISKYNLGDVNGACLDWSKAGELGFVEAYDYIKKFCK